MGKIFFEEKQSFRQIFIWIICILIFGIFLWGIIQQIILNIPWGNNPSSDLGLILFGIIPVAIIILLFTLKLTTKVKEDGIYFKFNILNSKFKSIKKEEIATYKIIKYKPLEEFGGWGIRFAMKKNAGRAYNVSGNIGMQFELKNGRKILIGTQYPEKFKNAVDEMMINRLNS